MPEDATILVVDDSPNVLKIVSTILTSKGYKVDTCEDIDKASQLIESRKPNLILLDIMMPSEVGLDGISLFNRLKENEETARIPIIFLSGIAQGTQQTEEDLKERAGADDFICKPFEAEDLLRRVEKLLSKKGKGVR